MKIVKSLLLSVLSLPLFAVGDSSVPIRWGVAPFTDVSWNANGTTLCDGGAEMGVESFNAHPYTFRLAEVGDGTFDETDGFKVLFWIDSAHAERASERWLNMELDGDFTVYSSVSVPITRWGNYDEAGEDVQMNYWDYEYYEEIWAQHKFTVMVYDESAKRAYRLSSTQGGTEIPESVFAAFGGEIMTEEYDPMAPWAVQQPFYLIANTPSKTIYLGAEIPQKCVWMADKGLAAADLAGYDEKAVALAMALDKVPGEVAGGVELKIGSISLDPQAGTATLAFQFTATDGNGESAAVSSLRGGARLLLETASSAGDLGTENASKQEVSLSSATLTIPTSGEAFFARLVLDTP